MEADAVLDASALLAFLQREPGFDAVRTAIDSGCAVSVVNVAEVLSKGAERGRDPAESLRELAELDDRLEFVPVERDDLVSIAALRPLTRNAGLSLADRACLALGRRLGVSILTTDRAWADLGLPGVKVTLVR